MATEFTNDFIICSTAYSAWRKTVLKLHITGPCDGTPPMTVALYLDKL